MNYHTWTFIGMGVMKDAENHSFDERVRVAADVEALFEREAKESGYYSEIDMAYGTIYITSYPPQQPISAQPLSKPLNRTAAKSFLEKRPSYHSSLSIPAVNAAYCNFL